MRSKRIQQLGSAIALTGMLSLATLAPAFAADSSISNTGPDSHNTIENSVTNTVTVTNDNNVTVTNSNDQTAKSGSAKVSENTTAGSATSGNASNNNGVTTTVAIGNSSSPVPGSGNGSGSSGGTGSGASAGSGSTAGASSLPGKGGAVKASAMPGMGGGAVATLPKTGCSQICDVSALRAAYRPFGGITATTLKGASNTSAILLGVAVLLSLISAGGSAFYATKRARA